MKIKHKDLIPDENQPFLNCELGREKYSTILSKIIQDNSDGFVLALNGEWGTGKTTFVKMWQKQLDIEKYKTIYFNAWENDFENEPLIAILGEFKKLVNDNDETFKSLLKKGAIISKNILPAIAKGIISKYLNAEVALTVVEKSLEAATEILEKEIDTYIDKKQGLIDFKKQLEIYIEKNSSGKPIIFIIDELDRCKPSYAVEILEKVKHFFSVQGIVFVLSIDKIQLGYSIQGYYGSSNINAEEYLRRFIDIEYSLPAPEGIDFCKYLYNYYEFDDFFQSVERRRHSDLRDDGSIFINFSVFLFENQKYTLRQQEKMFSQAKLILQSVDKISNVFPTLLFILIHLKNFEFELYNNIIDKKLTIQDLVFKLEDIFSVEKFSGKSDRDVRLFCIAESYLLIFYNNYIRIPHKSKTPLFLKEGDVEKLTFKTKTINLDENDILLRLIPHLESYRFDGVKIDYLINKINLYEINP